jgi:hypothetical protein
LLSPHSSSEQDSELSQHRKFQVRSWIFTSRKLSRLQISNNSKITGNDDDENYDDDDDDDDDDVVDNNDSGSDGDNNVIFSFDDFSCLVTFLFVTRRINEENRSYTSS